MAKFVAKFVAKCVSACRSNVEPLRALDDLGYGRAIERVSEVIGDQREPLGMIEIATALNQVSPLLSPSAD